MISASYAVNPHENSHKPYLLKNYSLLAIFFVADS